MSIRAGLVRCCWVALLPVVSPIIAACSESVEDPGTPPLVLAPTIEVNEDTMFGIDAVAAGTGSSTLSVTDIRAPNEAVERVEMSGRRRILVTPKKNFHGQFTMTFVVNDGPHRMASRADVTVRPVDDPPVALDSSLNVRGNVMLTLQASDPDGDPLSFEITQGPVHGSLTGTPPLLLYTPARGYMGPDQLTFKARDGGQAVTATIWLSVVTPPVPTALSGFAQGVEDQPLTLFLSAIQGDGALTYVITRQPQHGTISGTPPLLTYTPEANFFGTDSLEFFVQDASLSSEPATLSIDVLSSNDPPIAEAQTVETAEDTPRAINLIGSDPDGGSVRMILISGPTNGSLNQSGATWTYTPRTNFHGTDSFRFAVTSGFFEQSLPATVTIEVASVPDPPLATAMNRRLAEDSSVAFTLAGSDGDGEPIGDFHIVRQPAHGEITGTLPSVTYRPAANYAGEDSFTFTVASGGATSEPATVSFIVDQINDPPMPTSGTASTAEDTQVAIVLQGSDVENQPLTFATLAPLPEGTWGGSGANRTYTPAPNMSGVRTLRFRVSDGNGGTADGTIEITIAPVNDPPTALDDFAVTDPGTPVTLDLARNDLDVEGDAFTIAPADEPEHGSVAVADGKLVYTPDDGFTDTDVFTYAATDVHGATSIATVHVGVGAFPLGAPRERLLTIGADAASEERSPAISADGRHIAFSSAIALLPGDTNGAQDIYLFDRGARTLTRVSVASGGGEGDGPSRRPHLSASGRYLVFESRATNLVAGDTNEQPDVFRHDRVTGETVRISVASDGAQGSGQSVDPEISDDGNLIAFASTSSELIPDDNNGAADVFVRDVMAGTTTRVSVTSSGGEVDLGSIGPAISGDGQRVAFESLATNLVPGDSNALRDVFVHDRITGTTTRVSVSSTGVESSGESSGASISRTGRFVSFLSTANNLVPGVAGFRTVYFRDVQMQNTTTPAPIGRTAHWARMSDSGRYITVFDSDGVRVCNRVAAVCAPPTTGWSSPVISDSGSYIAVIEAAQGIGLTVLPNPLAPTAATSAE